MSSQTRYDVIVIGAGVAGVTCAAELVIRGRKPLLVCETKEVAHTLRSEWVGGCAGVMQLPAWQVAWGGGWWYPLARELDIPVKFRQSPPFNLVIRGTSEIHTFPFSPSASAITELLEQISPLPIGDSKEGFQEILRRALAIPYQDLLDMHDVPLVTWLQEQGADELLVLLIVAMSANLSESDADVAAEHLSVLGAFGLLRSFVCAEANLAVIEPDAQEGLMVPMAKAIQDRGGTVVRSRKVARILIENERAVGVQFTDGEEVYADHVAVAAGTPRVPRLFDEAPAELEAPLAYAASLAHRDVSTYAVLDRPVTDFVGLLLISDMMGSNLQLTWPLHAVAPWSTPPGHQFIASSSLWRKDRFDDAGGADKIAVGMHDLCEEVFPGYAAASVATATQCHEHLWLQPLAHGPKLPRRMSTIDRLWFVGDGSTPIGGLGVEAAASAGILGAREIADQYTR